jgi:hypothetical protein
VINVMSDKQLMSAKRYALAAFILCAAAGVLYNSWPLGYVLDSPTAHRELASSLERAGHPYYWVFLLADLLTALSVVAAGLIMRLKLWGSLKSAEWSLACAGLIMFGLFTAASALAPARCIVGPTLKCGAGGLGLGLDAFASGIAALGLLAGLTGLSARRMRHGARDNLARATLAALAALLAGDIVFVVLALFGGNSDTAQYVQLAFSGAALLVLGLNVRAEVPRA